MIKLSDIKKSLSYYEKTKSLRRRIAGDPTEIIELKKIFAVAVVDRDISSSEFFALSTLLADLPEDKASAEFFSSIRVPGSLMIRLKNDKLLSRPNVKALYSYAVADTNLQSLENAWIRLPHGLRNQENFSILMEVLSCWVPLPEALQTENNFSQINLLVSASQSSVIRMFNELPDLLKTQENFNSLIKQKEFFSTKLAGIFLRDVPSQLFFQDLFDQIIRYAEQNRNKEIYAMINPLISVEGTYYALPEILRTVDNLYKLREIFNASYQSNVGASFDNARLMRSAINSLPIILRTQENFDILAQNADELIPLFLLAKRGLSRLPRHLFTQEVFNELILLDGRYKIWRAAGELLMSSLEIQIERLVDDILHNGRTGYVERTFPLEALRMRLGLEAQIEREGGVPQSINVATQQSTHTSSVHDTASETATNLMKRYGHLINSESQRAKLVKEMTTWADQLINNKSINETDYKKYITVKQTITLITDPLYVHEDPTSHVSTLQLLLLCWIAFHDGQNPNFAVKFDFNDCEKRFIDGLYDISRAYNVDENFKEINPNSANINTCLGGAFNKLPETGAGTHPDFKQIVLSSKLAGLKVQRLASTMLIAYLSELHEKATTTEKQTEFLDLLNQLNESEEGIIDVVWNVIEPAISSIMIEEYGPSEVLSKLNVKPLFGSAQDSTFKALVSSGKWINIDELKLKERFSRQAENTSVSVGNHSQQLDLGSSSSSSSSTSHSRVTGSDFPSDSSSSSSFNRHFQQLNMGSSSSGSSHTGSDFPSDSSSSSSYNRHSQQLNMGSSSSSSSSRSHTGSDFPSDSSSSSSFGMFSAPTPTVNFLTNIINELSRQTLCFENTDKGLRTALLGIKNLAERLGTMEPSAENINKLELNILRQIGELKHKCKQVSLIHENYENCLDALSKMKDELAEIKSNLKSGANRISPKDSSSH